VCSARITSLRLPSCRGCRFRAELWLNEIFTEYSRSTADALVELTSSLLLQGLRVDGVGLQGHIMFGEPDYALVEDTMRRLGDLA